MYEFDTDRSNFLHTRPKAKKKAPKPSSSVSNQAEWQPNEENELCIDISRCAVDSGSEGSDWAPLKKFCWVWINCPKWSTPTEMYAICSSSSGGRESNDNRCAGNWARFVSIQTYTNRQSRSLPTRRLARRTKKFSRFPRKWEKFLREYGRVEPPNRVDSVLEQKDRRAPSIPDSYAGRVGGVPFCSEFNIVWDTIHSKRVVQPPVVVDKPPSICRSNGEVKHPLRVARRRQPETL